MACWVQRSLESSGIRARVSCAPVDGRLPVVLLTVYIDAGIRCANGLFIAKMQKATKEGCLKTTFSLTGKTIAPRRTLDVSIQTIEPTILLFLITVRSSK